MAAMEAAGFRYRRTWSREETALVIADLYRFWSKSWNEHKTFHTFDNSRAFVGMRRPNQCEVTAASLPGVGWDRAQAVAKKFGTVEKLAGATEGDIASVPGIGKVTARKVWRALRGLK
jgi:ERCC4-type nuclease